MQYKDKLDILASSPTSSFDSANNLIKTSFVSALFSTISETDCANNSSISSTITMSYLGICFPAFERNVSLGSEL